MKASVAEIAVVVAPNVWSGALRVKPADPAYGIPEKARVKALKSRPINLIKRAAPYRGRF
tara:strand:- start:392 stop:571 length:180 start_codon:yes stop_codon:yes gene_type:complete